MEVEGLEERKDGDEEMEEAKTWGRRRRLRK